MGTKKKNSHFGTPGVHTSQFVHSFSLEPFAIKAIRNKEEK